VPNDGAAHRVRISVAHSSSTDGIKCVKLREKNEELKQVTKSTTAKKGQDLVLQMQFLVKDYSNLASNLFTRVNLVDTGSFFGLKPADVLKDDKKFKEKVQQLERFNVWIEAAVTRKN